MTANKLKKNPQRPKIKTKNKFYPLEDCALYNLSMRRFEKIIGISPKELSSLAGSENYHVFFIKQGRKKREIQAPNYDLDKVHTRIASLMCRIETPDYLHSGVKRRSNITNATAHKGEHPVLTLDIKSFFPSVTQKSIFNFFHSRLNIARDISGLLATVCSFDGHLPTGSRISMPLAFWSNIKLFENLYELSVRHNAMMTLFVDDLTFSGVNVNEGFKHEVKKLIKSAGHTVHPHKTKLYSAKAPKLVTGVVIEGGNLLVRNKHHKNIHTLISEMKVCGTEKEQVENFKKLLGSLNAAGQIDPKYKQMANDIRVKSYP